MEVVWQLWRWQHNLGGWDEQSAGRQLVASGTLSASEEILMSTLSATLGGGSNPRRSKKLKERSSGA